MRKVCLRTQLQYMGELRVLLHISPRDAVGNPIWQYDSAMREMSDEERHRLRIQAHALGSPELREKIDEEDRLKNEAREALYWREERKRSRGRAWRGLLGLIVTVVSFSVAAGIVYAV